jgi:acetyl-CoA acetyltransferase
LIAYPLHLLMCCLVTDGGGAIVLTSAERARVLGSPKPPVRVLGVAEAFESPLVLGLEDPTRSRAIAESSRAAIAQARIDRSDIDHLMIYDAFAHVPIFGLEAIGFVERGQAAAFIADGNTAPGGSLPMNTNGGGLSYTHTGMYGMYAIQEGIRQIRGEAAAQVPKVDVSLIQAVGGMFMSSGCLILGSSRTE